ncbi:sugar O-acetyltransferase [Microbacterium sp. A93]|uniref:sugar O-acetyltransferase n=1 Tax=Microbacterium sp. A93 TaxID=3450716 RepID=UPI003F427176
MTPAAETPTSPFFPDDRTMYERMVSGAPYLAHDAEIAALSTRAQLLTEQYNATSITEGGLRRRLLDELLGTNGEGIEIRPPFRVDYGRHLHLGDRTFANFGLVALDCAEIRIGADVQIATHVQLLTATHPLEPGPRRDGWEGAAPITIGDNVWLGGGVIVGPGVSIGENTVVGAGSVVTRDLPADVVAVGVPARPIKDLPADPSGGWDRGAAEDA